MGKRHLPDRGPTPDSPIASAFVASPNYGERREGCQPDMLVLHYTGMPEAEAAFERLCDPTSEVSAHYLVFEDGRVVQLVAEARRAWHAGAGCWAGLRDINSVSIGVEIVNPGHDGGLPPFPDEQIEAVIGLGRDIVERWSIEPTRVLAHSDIAPSRKEDPGERFPWDRLARAGLGHWVEPEPLNGDGVDEADRPPIEALQAMFARYGYDLPETGRLDDATVAVVKAFQRHFRPARVDGAPDASTVATLRRLLASANRLPSTG